MPFKDIQNSAKEFLNLIKLSKSAVVLTGAGISTESGIPDYRSPGTGLWENMDMSTVSINGFLKDPSCYYSYALNLYPMRNTAKPNAGHLLLARLEEKGFIKGVITQNVDGLHYKAGSVNVHEVHGSLRQVVCMDCCLLFPMEGTMERVKGGENPPLCEECGGVLKPNAVFFGENLPKIPWEESCKLVKDTDLLITLGSSLQVSPANILPDIALRNRARLIIVNLTSTPYDFDADLVVRRKIAILAGTIIESDLIQL